MGNAPMRKGGCGPGQGQQRRGGQRTGPPPPPQPGRPQHSQHYRCPTEHPNGRNAPSNYNTIRRETTVVGEHEESGEERQADEGSRDEEAVSASNVNMSTADFQDDMPSLHCPICYNKYNDTTHTPRIHPDCGHTLCTTCLQVMLDMNKPVSCGTCGRRAGSESFKKNFNLMSLIEELGVICSPPSPIPSSLPAENELECSGCMTRVADGKLRLCTGCALTAGITVDGATVEQMMSYTLCAECLLDGHNGHDIVKFVTWKNSTEVRLFKEESASRMADMQEQLSGITVKGREKLQNYNKMISCLRVDNGDVNALKVLDTKVHEAVEKMVNAEMEAYRVIEEAIATLGNDHH